MKEIMYKVKRLPTGKLAWELWLGNELITSGEGDTDEEVIAAARAAEQELKGPVIECSEDAGTTWYKCYARATAMELAYMHKNKWYWQRVRMVWTN